MTNNRLNPQVDSIIKKQLTREDTQKVMTVGVAKMAKLGMAILRALCTPCRQRAMHSRKLPVSEYCASCQEKIKQIHAEYMT